MNFNKPNRLFILLSLVIALADVLFVYITHIQSRERLASEKEQLAKNYFSAFEIAYQSTKENLLQISNVFAYDPHIKKLFLKGKRAVEEGGGSGNEKAKAAREDLYAAVGNNWQQFTKKFHARQLHFHLGPGSTSFLRVHKPHKFGDNMDNLRHTIVATNKYKQPVTGFETGRIYSGIRGVNPVSIINDAGKLEHIGAVEAGVSFAIVLQNLSTSLNVDASVLLYEHHLRNKVWPSFLQKILDEKPPINGLVIEETTSRLINSLLLNSANSTIRQIENSDLSLQTVNINDQHYLYATQPLRDYLGNHNIIEPDAGQIAIWKNITNLHENYNKNFQTNIYYAISSFFLIEIFIFFAIRKISNQLNTVITNKTAEIDLRAQISQILQQSLPLKERLELVLAILCTYRDLKPQNKAGVVVQQKDSTDCEVLASFGDFLDQTVNIEHCLKINEITSSQIMSGEKIEVIGHCITNHESMVSASSAHGHYIVPIKYSDVTLGILFLTTASTPSKKASKLELLTSIAQMIALAVSNDNASKALVHEKNNAEKANKAKSEFLSSMSHELRTPLNAILGFSQLLLLDEDEPLTQNQRKDIDQILMGGDHLLKLINDVLDFAKIEAGNVYLSLESISAKQLLDECLTFMQPNADKYKVHLNTSCCCENLDNILIYADYLRTKQVLLNLLSNAAKYNRKNGTIHLNCNIENDRMFKIIITDTGYGISEENQRELFKPFSRLGAENSDIEGTGIGLVVCKELIEKMQGSIGFDSKVDIGSSFWFKLPILKQANITTENKTKNTPVVQELSGCLLYIEDNQSNVLLMEKLALRFDGLDLLTATTAEEGMKIAEKIQPDLIFMDISLPGISGIEALHQLKSNPITEKIPVFALSAAATIDDKNKSKGIGFEQYLTKPFEINQIINVLCNILGKNDSL